MEPSFVIVEQVESGSAAEQAGLRYGDRLSIYSNQPLVSPAMLLALVENTFGIESVSLHGERDGQPQEWTLPLGKMGVEARPELPATILLEYEQGREEFQAKQYAEAARIWKDVATHVPEKAVRAWLYQKSGEASRLCFDYQASLTALNLACDLLEGSKDTAALEIVWSELGHCYHDLCDLTAAWKWVDMARKADEYENRPLWLARRLVNLGIFCEGQGKLASAWDYYMRARDICERLVPDSLHLAKCLNNLANVAFDLGNSEISQDYYKRAQDIQTRFTLEPLETAANLTNFGVLAINQGDLAIGQHNFIQALEIWERLLPGSGWVAMGHDNLGTLALMRSELTEAQNHFERALDMRQQLFGSLSVAGTMGKMGVLAAKRGDLKTAQEYYASARTIQERLAPNSLNCANLFEEEGRIAFAQQHFPEALTLFSRSVEIIEHQRNQIVTSEARALLLADHIRKYMALMQGYLEVGDINNAFLTLERSRARSLLELLAARTQDVADAPPELLREQQEIDRQRSQTYDQLSQVTGAEQDAEKVAALHRILRELERRQQDLTAQIRAASPHYADLQYPQPLSLEAAQATLEPGTLLLSYLVDEDRTSLFAVTATHAEAYVLPVGMDALQEQVRSFRQALNRERLTHDPKQETAQGRALYAQLLQPVTEAVRRADRLLICPDGPLHTLPFAALVTNSRGRPTHLGAQKALSHIQSATIYAQVRAARSRPQPNPPLETGPRRLLAFGDPLYRVSARTPERLFGNEELSLLQTRGLSLAALPNSRVEVESLARLFGDDATVRLGAEATKTAVLADSGRADRLHFACHAWFDPEMPLSSGLIFSQPEALGEQTPPGDNGLLQAWEIFQKLTLSADLVVLSACQSGLGQEVRGEGLVGLTRAFQYAGARSLVVSLWDVNDASTSLFMQSFYAALRDGEGKDEALRQGVLALQAEPRWNSPYYWGAFILIGDRN